MCHIRPESSTIISIVRFVRTVSVLPGAGNAGEMGKAQLTGTKTRDHKRTPRRHPEAERHIRLRIKAGGVEYQFHGRAKVGRRPWETDADRLEVAEKL